MAKNILKVLFVIMGTIIGAGFASGKEIYNFFVRFGSNGIIGILISGGLTGIIVFCVLKIVKEKSIENNNQLIKEIKGGKILYQIVTIFLLASFYIMVAGFSSFFKQEYNIPNYMTSTILCVILYVVLIKRTDGIIKINTIICPILIIIMFYIIIKYNLNFEPFKVKQNNLIISIINAILYSSYNSIILIPILINLKKYIKTPKENIIISVTTAIFTILLTLGIFVILSRTNQNVNKFEIPMVSIISNNTEKLFYSVAIEIAIFTSALSAGFGVLENVPQNKKNSEKNYKKITFIMCALGVPISQIGFGKLVGSVYPLFGLLGLMQIILILRNNLEKIDKN